jgi:hypothetical protein
MLPIPPHVLEKMTHPSAIFFTNFSDTDQSNCHHLRLASIITYLPHLMPLEKKIKTEVSFF